MREREEEYAGRKGASGMGRRAKRLSLIRFSP